MLEKLTQYQTVLIETELYASFDTFDPGLSLRYFTLGPRVLL
jgi:hypothetical protein